ncbi:MAG: helix-turn-helix domain-containing protein [Verrucomicrobiota bacterium]
MHENLGDKLRIAREASGVTIEDVAFRAKIPRPVIEALEAEDFGFFTSPLYARSFLKQYGEYIGADVEPWLADFVPAVMIDSDSVESILGGSESTSDHSSSTESEKNMSAIWGPIWIFLITLAVIWAGVKIYEKIDSKHTQTEQSEPYISPEVIADELPVATPVEPAVTEPTEPDAPRRAVIVEPAPE